MGQCTSCGGKHAAAASTAMTTTKRNNQLATRWLPPSPEPARCDPNPWIPSCETQNALAACLKQVICDFLRCVNQTVCEDGKLNLRDDNLGRKLVDCIGVAACGALACIPDALCPVPPAQPPAVDDLPCNFAVEES
jgi:hypothetical protein